MTALRLAPIVLLLFVAGCVKPPPRQNADLDLDVPESWTATDETQPEIHIDWWDDFDDPSLSALVELAVENNRDLAAAATRIDRAAAEARIAGADLKPQISAGLSGGRQRQAFVGLPIPGAGDGPLSTTSSRAALSVEIGWEIDLWGRVRAGARAAVADMQATEAELYGAQLSVAGRAAKLWFAVVEARQQADLARQATLSFRGSVGQVRARFERGVRPALDLRLALSNLAAAEALEQLRLRQLDLASRQLEVLVGRYPDGTTVATFLADELPGLPPPPPAGMPAELLQRRPDLVAAERRLAASDQRYLQARKSLLPRLSLTASGGTVSDQLQDLLNGDFRVWSILGGLTQPIFQGGRLRAGVERADAVEREVLELYAARALDAFAEVETALAAEDFLAEREKYLAESAHQLLAALSLAEDRYRNGIGIYLTVLDSQTRVVTAESNRISVRRQRLDNRIDLHLALGGGFGPPPDPATTTANVAASITAEP